MLGAHRGRHVHLQPDRQRRAGHDAGQGRVEAAVVEHGRVQAADQLAQLGQRLDLASSCASLDGLPGGLGGTSSPRAVRAMPRFMASDTSRCCAPSCRSRSMRRRSASAAATTSARLRASACTRSSSCWAGLGPSSLRAARTSTLVTARATHGAARNRAATSTSTAGVRPGSPPG